MLPLLDRPGLDRRNMEEFRKGNGIGKNVNGVESRIESLIRSRGVTVMSNDANDYQCLPRYAKSQKHFRPNKKKSQHLPGKSLIFTLLSQHFACFAHVFFFIIPLRPLKWDLEATLAMTHRTASAMCERSCQRMNFQPMH